MSLLDIFQKFASITHNPELESARIKHDSLPRTQYGEGVELSKDEAEKDRKITFKRGYELGQLMKVIIEEHYFHEDQQRVKENLSKAITYLASEARIFPDMDYQDIWYTDYYDLIVLAKDMGLGDDTLPHWPEEPNSFKRYLELNISALGQMFLGFSEEALLEEYKFGADLECWIRYILRETLKSRQRFSRERQKQGVELPSLRTLPSAHKPEP